MFLHNCQQAGMYLIVESAVVLLAVFELNLETVLTPQSYFPNDLIPEILELASSPSSEKLSTTTFLRVGVYFWIEEAFSWNGISKAHSSNRIFTYQYGCEVEGHPLPVPLYHWLVRVEYDPGACLWMGSQELMRCPQGHSAGVYGFCCTGLCPSHTSSCSHSCQLVGPVSIHSCQDVVDQRVEMDSGEVWGSAFTLPVFLQDPKKDITDHAHIRNTIPRRQRRVRSSCWLAKK